MTIPKPRPLLDFLKFFSLHFTFSQVQDACYISDVGLPGGLANRCRM